MIWHREDVSAWVETSRIEDVTIEYPRKGDPNDGRVCFPHTMAGKWPVFNDDGNLGEGNVWVFGLIDGVWHAAPAEWLKPGQTCKRFTNETSTDDTLVGHRAAHESAASGNLGTDVRRVDRDHGELSCAERDPHEARTLERLHGALAMTEVTTILHWGCSQNRARSSLPGAMTTSRPMIAVNVRGTALRTSTRARE